MDAGPVVQRRARISQTRHPPGSSQWFATTNVSTCTFSLAARDNSGLPCHFEGGEFLLERIKVKGEQRCYFAVSEEGLPVRTQRKPYTECFFIIALSELFRATGNEKYQVRKSILATCLTRITFVGQTIPFLYLDLCYIVLLAVNAASFSGCC